MTRKANIAFVISCLTLSCWIAPLSVACLRAALSSPTAELEAPTAELSARR